MADNIKILQDLSLEKLPQFVYGCIDVLIGKSGDLETISKEHDWSEETVMAARSAIQNACRSMVFNPNYKIEDELEFDPEKIEVIKKCYEIRKSEIQSALTKEVLSKSETGIVTDFDWKLKWILGSSTLASVREPLLQLSLTNTKKADNGEIETSDIDVEMDRSELNKFVTQLKTHLAKLNNVNP